MKPKWPKRDGKTSRINQQKTIMENLKKSLSIIVLVATGFAIVGICLTAWNFIFHLFNL